MEPPSLPNFKDGIMLSASDLNRISANQVFLNEAVNALNFPFQRIRDIGDNRTMIHRYRYLHWNTAATTAAHLIIHGVDVGAVAASATSGRIDLGNGFGYQGANPYNLNVNRVYTIRWNAADVECKQLYEHTDVNSAITLSYNIPSFSSGQVLTADQLNRLSADTRYLYDYAHNVPTSGFLGRTYFLADKGANRGYWANLYWVFRKRHRYLHFSGTFNPNGSSGSHYGFELHLNGVEVYTDGAEYNEVTNYDFVLDMESAAGNINFRATSGSFRIQPSNPTLGSLYEVKVEIDTNDPYNPNGKIAIHHVIESPTNERL